jgi:phosphoribosylformylglycinamidine synthase
MLLEKMEMTVTYLGTVTSGNIKINGEDWGHVNDWKEKYENAIANLLAGHESEHALAAL